MDIRGYYLYRVSYFVLNSGVSYSTVVAKTAREAEDIIMNCHETRLNAVNAAVNVTRLHAISHISPELLLEVFSH